MFKLQRRNSNWPKLTPLNGLPVQKQPKANLCGMTWSGELFKNLLTRTMGSLFFFQACQIMLPLSEKCLEKRGDKLLYLMIPSL